MKGFVKISDKRGYYIEPEKETPYNENGFLRYGHLVELCEYIEDNGFMATMFAIAKTIDEAKTFLSDPDKHMFKYSSPKYIG